MNMFGDTKVKTFELKDLVERTVMIRSFSSKEGMVILAIDTSSGELFVLECSTFELVQDSLEFSDPIFCKTKNKKDGNK